MTKRYASATQRRLIPTYIFLILWSLFSVFPIFWMVTAATNTSLDVAKGKLWFGNQALINFHHLLARADLFGGLGNSFLYAVVQTLLAILICSLAGYGFELYHSPSKDRLLEFCF